MTYYLVTYGCQMNKSDSERIAFILEKMGIKKSSSLETANIVVFNLCSVRQASIDRAKSVIFRVVKKNQSKKTSQKQKILVTGCLLPKDQKLFRETADFVFKIDKLSQLPQKIDKLLPQTRKKMCLPGEYLKMPTLSADPYTAYVPIMTGCNNFCSYCVVPYTRGREKSLEPEIILKNVKELLAQGYKRIILLGQNVNSYKGASRNGFVDFPSLLKRISRLPGDFWLAFITSHPKDLSDDLIKVVFSSKKICKYFHLPIQSGSDAILKKMNRGYTVKQYSAIIRKIKKAVGKQKLLTAISTDVILGFPGEKNSDFAKTKRLLQKVCYDMVYSGKYSPRELTSASKLKNDIDNRVKDARQKLIQKVIKDCSFRNNKKYVGKTMKILVEGKNNQYLLGQNEQFKNVRCLITPDAKERLVGKFVLVKIIQANPWGLIGNLAS